VVGHCLLDCSEEVAGRCIAEFGSLALSEVPKHNAHNGRELFNSDYKSNPPLHHEYFDPQISSIDVYFLEHVKTT